MTLSLDLGFYTNKLPADQQKLRGGYYTPIKLARYLAEWAIRRGTERVLEPSCGDGNFLVAALEYLSQRPARRKKQPEFVSVEIEAAELRKAQARCAALPRNDCVEWLHGDFFELYGRLRKGEGFDVVVGNPPFIRFQYFDPESRDAAFHHLRSVGYHPTRLANAWTAFVQLSIELLREGGRLALVVPAELLQVTYAAELRNRLASRFEHIVLVSFRKLVFPEIQQEVLLLLAEGKREVGDAQSDIHTITFEDGDELLATNHLRDAVAHMPAKHSRPGMKWTALFLGEQEFRALDAADQVDGLIRLGEVADVDVGIVTGRNSFFMMTEKLRRELKASRLTIPTVGRTSALRSIVFGKGDFEAYRKQHPAYVLALEGVPASKLPGALLSYLRHGEAHKIHQGYKCRIRTRWYDVPSVYVPDAFVFRQIHSFPLLVVNNAKVTSTDTIHRVRFKTTVDAQLLAAASFNSLTLAWAEVCGRSYGGGVLELEPREAEQLPVPYASKLGLDVERVDALIRRGRYADALAYVDRVVLKRHMGFTDRMINLLRSGWQLLRDRRRNRRR